MTYVYRQVLRHALRVRSARNDPAANSTAGTSTRRIAKAQRRWSAEPGHDRDQHEVFYDRPSDGDDPGRPLVQWAFCKRPGVIAEALDRLTVLATSRP